MPLVRNPILPGFNADPSIIRVADDGNATTICSWSERTLTFNSEYELRRILS